MKSRLCLSILTVGLVMSLNGAASAQSVGRNSGVVDRPRPDYDPLGIRVGAFSFYPSILASETYNDNIFATNQNAESDFITVVQPEARLSSNWSRHSLSLVGFGRFSRFLQESNQNTDEWGGAMNGVLDLASWGNATGNALYQRAVQPRTDPENPGGEKPSLYDRTQVIGTYDRAFQRLLTRFEVELNQYDFLSAEDLLLDRTETAVSVRLGYQISPRLAAYVRRQLEDGKTVQLTSGTQLRDFLDVSEAGAMIADVVETRQAGAINICSGEAVTIRTFVERIADEYGRRDLLEFGTVPPHASDPAAVVGVCNLVSPPQAAD